VGALEERNKQAAGREAVREEGSRRAPLPTESEEGRIEPPLPYGYTGFNLAHAVQGMLGGSHAAAEWFFIVVSLLAAGLGIGLGYLFYVKRPELPDVWAARLSTIYRASLNKYWVDELYGALVTRRTMDAARGVYAFDSKAIDGAVNGAAWLTRKLSRFTGAFDRLVVDGAVNGVAGFIRLLMSPLLRAAQTGVTANYALVMVIGLIAAVGLYFGKDIIAAITGAR
jgi:NADH:ubiquinone oxidoreductase subunit 5 (subunit L)/multisubunit Na+/H+ antiporter MnhA subunit